MSRPTFARSTYDVVVVGAGIIGLYTAYRLARAGGVRVVAVDRGYLSNGASGRNGGGVRQQWMTPATIRLARESVEAYRRFPKEFGYNPWFRQSGYLFLADSAEALAQLDETQRRVAAEGLAARRLSPDEVRALLPDANLAGVTGGSYLATDGVLYPFPAVWGVYEAARARGAEIVLGHEFRGAAPTPDGAVRVVTSAGVVTTAHVVNAAGAWSADVARRAGLDLPNVAVRHEICATEPLKPFLDPMVVRASDGLYVSQTMRGELVGGLTMSHPPGLEPGARTSGAFFARYARALLGLFPQLGSLGILRAWAGYYDESPDGLPFLGPDPRAPWLVHANGLGGHGFMLAPAVGDRVARAVLGEPAADSAVYSLARWLAPEGRRPAERLTLG